MSNLDAKVHPGSTQPPGMVSSQPVSSNAFPDPTLATGNRPSPPTYAEARGSAAIATETAAVPSQQAVYLRRSLKVVCHCCGDVVMTSTRAKIGLAVAGSIFALIFIGCEFGCCLVPLCVRDMYDTVHSCPSCRAVLGVHKVVKL